MSFFQSAILRQKNYELIKKSKKSALFAFSQAPFTYLFASLVCLTFALGFYWIYRLGSMALGYIQIDGFFLMFVCYFISVPVFCGFFGFITQFLLTNRRNFNIIFYYSTSPRLFAISLKSSLNALCCFALGGLVMYTLGTLPKLVSLSDQWLLAYGILLAILACLTVFLCLSKICLGSMDGGAAFFGAFWLHYIIAYFTKGIYLIFLLPYILLSIFYYIKEKEEKT